MLDFSYGLQKHHKIAYFLEISKKKLYRLNTFLKNNLEIYILLTKPQKFIIINQLFLH